ncbi:MAG: DNA ligase, partial [Bacteroidetes bacterium]|nr:DNA ligase [Bacteroidota bacterium]
MSLNTYNQKRNFKSTSEPKGKADSSESAVIFVVQKHDASHLHYDFRLEVKGTLKSWAVPKGPSMNPNVKRLAMMVEDHPYSYKDFEGTIPEGNYGAGNVIVWDNGTYKEITSVARKKSESAIAAGIHKGHISFILKGKKLKGEFSLIKLKGKQENAWLLIKKDDKYATDVDILLKNRSVITKKILVERKKNSIKVPGKKATAVKRKAAKKKAKTSLAEIKPMLATLTDKPFKNPDWIFETKYDGYRAISVIGDHVDMVSRNNISFNKLFAPLLPELKKIPHHAILDGEVVIEDSNGRSNFQLLQNYQLKGYGELK